MIDSLLLFLGWMFTVFQHFPFNPMPTNGGIGVHAKLANRSRSQAVHWIYLHHVHVTSVRMLLCDDLWPKNRNNLDNLEDVYMSNIFTTQHNPHPHPFPPTQLVFTHTRLICVFLTFGPDTNKQFFFIRPSCQSRELYAGRFGWIVCYCIWSELSATTSSCIEIIRACLIP